MISEVIYLEYLSSLLEGNKPKCAAIVADLIAKKEDPKELYVNLFQRSLERVGRMWEADKICGATEHLATGITECMLSLMYPAISSVEKIGKKAVVACVPREFHQVGAKIVADMFELHGWESYFLGANTKASELFKMLKEKKPDTLALSVSLYLNVVRMIKLIDEVQEIYPEMEIIVGGRAFREQNPDIISHYSKVTYIPNLNKLENYISLRNRKRKVLKEL